MPQIRKFEDGDAEAVAQLAAESPGAAQWPGASYARLEVDGYRAWVAVNEETRETIGFIVTRSVAPEAEILNLAVAAECRSTGTGSALLRAALSELAADKIQRVFLEVRASNGGAISFYKKHLFRETGARLAYYRDPVEDAVLMERAV